MKEMGVAAKHLTFVFDYTPAVIAIAYTGKKMSIFLSRSESVATSYWPKYGAAKPPNKMCQKR